MSRMIKVKTVTAAMAMACAAISAPALARDVVKFSTVHSWAVGDVSDSRYADGLMVSLQIRSSHSDSKIYAVAEFCNRGSSEWAGGIRVSPDYPDSAHTTLRVPAGQCRRWGEHMDRTNTIFVFANRGE